MGKYKYKKKKTQTTVEAGKKKRNGQVSAVRHLCQIASQPQLLPLKAATEKVWKSVPFSLSPSPLCKEQQKKKPNAVPLPVVRSPTFSKKKGHPILHKDDGAA